MGHLQQAETLAQAAKAAEVTVDVLVDVDVGDRRTGILPGTAALELARQMAATKVLRVRGVQAYSGTASHTVGFEQRQKVSQTALEKAVQMRAQFQKAGLDARILSGGSTGTYNIDSEAGSCWNSGATCRMTWY